MRVSSFTFLGQRDCLMNLSGEDLVVDGARRLVSRSLITNFSIAKLLDQVLTITQIVVTFILSSIVTMCYLGPLYFSTSMLPSLSRISNFLINYLVFKISCHKCFKVVILLIMPVILSILMLRVLLLP